MAEEERKDLIARLADAGEDAIQRLADLPGASRFTDGLNQMRTRVDDLSRRVRGVEELERRVAALEERVEALAKQPKPRAARAATGSGAKGRKAPES
jgi:hypothetical protein